MTWTPQPRQEGGLRGETLFTSGVLSVITCYLPRAELRLFKERNRAPTLLGEFLGMFCSASWLCPGLCRPWAPQVGEGCGCRLVGAGRAGLCCVPCPPDLLFVWDIWITATNSSSLCFHGLVECVLPSERHKCFLSSARLCHQRCSAGPGQPQC